MVEDNNKFNLNDKNNISDPQDQSRNLIINRVFIAGIFLIIAGILTFISWLQFVTIDVNSIEQLIQLPQIQQLYTNITAIQLKETLVLCGSIGCLISIFSILAGILAIKRKFWMVVFISGIPQIFINAFIIAYIPALISIILALFGVVFIAVSRKDFN